MSLSTLVWRNLGRKKVRTALSLAAVVVAFLLFGLMAGLRQNFSAGPGSATATRLIVSNRIGAFEPLPLGYVERVRGIDGAADVTFRSFVLSTFRDPKNRFLMLATDPASFLRMHPDFVVDARARTAFEHDRNSILVGATLAQRFGWKAGDTVPISRRLTLEGGEQVVGPLRVAGVFAAREAGTGTGLALTHYEPFNERRASQRDTVGSIVVRASDAGSVDRVASAIDAAFANSGYETSTMTEEAFSRALVSQIGDIQTITLLVTAAGFFVILLVVGSAMSSTVRERGREFGAMRMIGFMPGAILRTIMAEALIIAVIGGLAGLFLASSVIGALRRMDAATFGRMELLPGSVAGAALLMLIFGVLVALAPALRVLRTDVADVLARK